MKSKYLLLLGAALCSLFTAVNPLRAQGTAFGYQGRLMPKPNPFRTEHEETEATEGEFGLGKTMGGRQP